MAADKLIDPIHQFEITKLSNIEIGGLDISFTNSSLFMFLAIGATMLLFTLGLSKRSIIPGRMQMLSELSYNFILLLFLFHRYRQHTSTLDSTHPFHRR